MSETPTGTDRGELTEDERERIIDEFTEGRNPWDFVAVVESIVAARVQAYAEKFESLSDRAKKAATELGRKNDRLAAELAAANARCAEHVRIDTAEKYRAKAEALQATLDRVTALADECTDCAYAYNQSDPLHHTYKGLANRLRAALTPEGTP